MSKKLTAKEQEKLIQELTSDDFAFNLDILGPSKKPRKSLKTPIEKVTNYQIVVEDSVFWPLVKLIWRWYKVFYRKKLTEIF